MSIPAPRNRLGGTPSDSSPVGAGDGTHPDSAIERVAAPLRQQVIARIRHALAAGEFKPGDRLIERDLTERWNVSRTVIREALRQFEAEGLVTIVANRGPVVATLSREEAMELYEVREELEPALARFFVRRASESQVASLHRALDQLAAALERGGYPIWLEAKREFYDVLFDGAASRAMGSLTRSLQDRAQYLRGLIYTSDALRRESFRDLEGVLEAVDRRDAEAAGDALRLHVKHLVGIALRVYDEADGDELEAPGQGAYEDGSGGGEPHPRAPLPA